MPERYLEPTHPTLEIFATLPVGEVLELPLDVLTPSDVDDWTSSHTPGPIEAYALRYRGAHAQRVGQVVLWIADGNHRYYTHLREGRTTIPARKVVPNPENDIRFMFGATDSWEDI